MKRGLKTLIVGIVLILLGSIVIPIALIAPLVMSDQSAKQFIVPGTAQFQADEPGRYYLWNDYQTVYQGTSYNESETIPSGLTFSITDSQGTPLSFISDTSISTTAGSSASNTIGYVETSQPDRLDINVSGSTSNRVFSFSQFSLGKLFGLIFGSACLCFVLVCAGVGIGIWGLVKLLRKPAIVQSVG